MKAEKKLTGLRFKQQALYLMIFSFVTVVVWIGGSLFSSQKRTGVSPELLELAKPLNPTINTALLEEIEARKSYTDEELKYFQVYKIIKSKDGRIQQVVPIESQLEEIPDSEVNLKTVQNQLNLLSPSTNLDQQLETGSGTFSQNAQDFASPSPSPSLTPEQQLQNRPTPPPGSGAILD
ncbi:hypothetical protein KJZ63_04665 [Patescibacteria group bacterium]|nr:hypothetical protein [Patescibacteria group bacterium]